ncbi:hypothetical protein HEK616_50310 [Streptomyces nigrescens]|uniref:Integral membrane protein n=2 Tax=Streptomyces TaxID=1883 RepID=A0ABN6QZA1_STRNI|nr:hypothetical protein [Streptomyces nigrescens]MEE4422072.1 hypothetical protein [Streptomyces sp. DSM 41528]BDM71544.1 hypothetical protein HEK616_50310 [Streptomyces nigrescens]
MKRKERARKLRRSGYRVLQWFFTVFFLALAALMVAKMGTDGPNGAPLGLTAIFGTIFVEQRILRSRIILSPGDVQVVNAIFEYHVEPGAIKEAFVDIRGNMKIEARDGSEIFVAAYSGSLIDSFVGSADRAAKVVRNHVAGKAAVSDFVIRRKCAVSWLSEIWLVAAVACAVWAAINNS